MEALVDEASVVVSIACGFPSACFVEMSLQNVAASARRPDWKSRAHILSSSPVGSLSESSTFISALESAS